MAYLFSRTQGISSHLKTIWGARIFHPVALLKLMFLQTWDGCLRESMDCSKGCRATCCIWCGLWDGYGFNEGQMCFILSWFRVHQSILHSWGDISVLLLWQCSWGFSSVPSGKSTFLMFLIGKMELLSMELPSNAGESGLILRRGGSLMSFLEFWQAPGVYSRVTTRMAIWNSSLLSEVRNPV